jgi:hypothetical protein
MVDEEGLPAGKQAGRSATIPALQFKPDVVVAALVGREWLTKETFPPGNGERLSAR